MSMPYSELPDITRPRARLHARGPTALSEVELLALQLRSGTRGQSATDLAIDLLVRFGSLDRLAAATLEELCELTGVGHAKAASIVAGFELARRLRPTERSTPVRGPQDIAAVASDLVALRRERVVVLVCDSSDRLLSTVTVSEGAVGRALISVRDILNAVLRHDGSSFALAHNHPSGDAEPSPADRRATTALESGARVVGLKFLGHVVVATGGWSEVGRET